MEAKVDPIAHQQISYDQKLSKLVKVKIAERRRMITKKLSGKKTENWRSTPNLYQNLNSRTDRPD
jgi:hypothetical protein